MPRRRVAAVLAAVAVAVGTAACASAAAPRSAADAAASPSPGGGSASAPGQSSNVGQPPNVVDADLYAGGSGYARTTDSLLWTDDFGADWRNVTPPGIALTQPSSWWNSAAILPDGHLWLALTPAPGDTSITLLRSDSPGGPWARGRIPLGALKIPRPGNGEAGVSVSFANPRDGWLLASWSVTHASSGELFATTDGGATWTLRADPVQLPGEVGPIHFLTPTVGVMDLDGSMFQLGWWITRDAGRHWARLQLPVPAADKHDTMSLFGWPTLIANTLVWAAQFTAPVQGDDAGIGIFRSADDGQDWTVQPVATPSGTAQYAFAVAPDGSAYFLLHSTSGSGSRAITWLSERSTDDGRRFTEATSVHAGSPGQITAADSDHLWAVASTSGCDGFKTDCRSTGALFASTDGGATWHRLALPT